MTERTQPTSGRRVTPGVAAAAAVTVVLLVVGVVALVLGLRGPAGSTASPDAAGPPQPATGPDPTSTAPVRPGPTTPSSPAPSASPGQGGTPTSRLGAFLPASAPTSIEIPAIGLRSTTFVPLRVQRDGTISVPGTAQEVGLYDAGPTPGQLGPSIVAAHVDTPSGVPGIFHQLGRVEVGNVVKVARKDGSHLTFTVDRVTAFRKSQFPTELVYKGDFTRSEIRLVTCGGPTDSRNEYRDNVVVFGHLTSAT